MAHLPALACDMIGRPGWRGVAVQMTPYLLHSRTLPHLYGTATSRCPNGQLGELRRTCTWEEPSTFIRSKLQCRHNFITKGGFLPSRRRLRCVRRGLASPSGLWVQSCRSHSRCLDARPLSFAPDSSVSTVCLVTRLRGSSRRRRLRGARHRGVRCTDAALLERRTECADVVCHSMPTHLY